MKRIKQYIIYIIRLLVTFRDDIKWIFIKFRYIIYKTLHPVLEFNYKNTPIIINNYNRVSYLSELINKLHSLGYNNLYIIDNASTFPPLLKYYDSIPYTVFRLKHNYGHLSLWKSGIYKRFKNQFFIYTDSDILPGDNCPENFIQILYDTMLKYKASKVGLALDINNIPDYFKHKDRVIKWEHNFWNAELENNVYLARIDTTFALYFPNIKGGFSYVGKHIRISGDLLSMHLPWYIDSSNPSEEELYYIQTCSKSASWAQLDKR